VRIAFALKSPIRHIDNSRLQAAKSQRTAGGEIGLADTMVSHLKVRAL
jgi:hypothetical protein